MTLRYFQPTRFPRGFSTKQITCDCIRQWQNLRGTHKSLWLFVFLRAQKMPNPIFKQILIRTLLITNIFKILMLPNELEGPPQVLGSGEHCSS